MLCQSNLPHSYAIGCCLQATAVEIEQTMLDARALHAVKTSVIAYPCIPGDDSLSPGGLLKNREGPWRACWTWSQCKGTGTIVH